MKELIEKNLRPGRKITDQFILATAVTLLVMTVSVVLVPTAWTVGLFEKILGGDYDAAVFLKDYFMFISLWVGTFLVVWIFKANRPMLNAVKYCSPGLVKGADGGDGTVGTVSGNGNRAGNNFMGLLIGLALGFGCNGFCILMSALMGDIYLEFSGFKPLPFILFFICVFIQSGAEEIIDRWYLYQKLRRRYKAPWIAIAVNSVMFMAMHIPNPGVTVLALVQILVVGILLSLIVYYYNGLWIAMAFHAGWNFTQSILFGLPNSGIVSAYSVFRLDAASASNGFFYSVNFGVEGSIGAVLILILVSAVIFWKNRGKGEHTDIWAAADQAAIEKAAVKTAVDQAAIEKTAGDQPAAVQDAGDQAAVPDQEAGD